MMRTTLFNGTLLTVAGHLLCFSPAVSTAQEERESEVRRVVKIETGDGPTVKIMPQIKLRGFLGIGLTPLTEELREHFGAPPDRGVMICRVAEDSPASRAGIQVGDVITEVDGEVVEGAGALARAIGEHEEGETVSLALVRDRRPQILEVAVVSRERQEIDVAPFIWRSAPSEEGVVMLDDGAISLDSERLHEMAQELAERFQGRDWEKHLERLRQHRGELGDRIEELEERLRALEAELRRLNPELGSG